MRGRELPYTSAFGQRDAMEYMQECYADEGVDRSGEPAVLVRASAAGTREVFHGNEHCGLMAGDGRHLVDASWMLLGDAQGVRYRPCDRCGSPAT
ncbi:hypothetical protein GCM10010313_40690 [Streptomyces violarus]|nr:hypothetical protein GCM10010313_40690 [Streptomyces violarus]